MTNMRLLSVDGADDRGGSGIAGPVDAGREPAAGRGGRRRGPRELAKAAAATWTAVRRVFGLSWQAGPLLTLGLGVTTVGTGLLPAATALIARRLFNEVATGYERHLRHLPYHAAVRSVLLLVTLQLLVLVAGLVFTAGRTICQQLLQEKVSLSIAARVMRHADRLDLAFFEESGSYDLLRQAQREVATRPVSMVSSAYGLAQNLVTFVSVVGVLAVISPVLAVIALVAPVPAFVADTRYGQRSFLVTMLTSPVRRRMDYLASLVTTDTYVKEVKAFGLGAHLLRRFGLLADAYYARQRRVIRTRYVAGAAWSTLAALAGSLSYLYVGLGVVDGRFSLGDLVLYTAAATSLQTAVQGVFQGLTGMYENNLYLNVLYRLLAARPTLAVAADPVSLPAPRGHVVFENVSFTYPGASQPALRGVDLEIRAGERLALVGRNGSGKSTVMKLLLRLYDPDRGRILVDGVDLRDVDPEELRRRIGSMFQDHVNYQATAGQNIGLGDVARIEDRPHLEQAAARAGAAEMVETLPEGYDTQLGKWFGAGTSLSGGQWQKLALARAFARDADLWVLDEPTAALDAQAEHDLFERLGTLAEGRSALYVSHRFSTVRMADRIAVLEGGRVIELGSHAELMDLDGEYARLFTLQAAAYRDEPANRDEVAAVRDDRAAHQGAAAYRDGVGG